MNFTPLEIFMQHMAKERTPGNAVEVYLRGKKVFRFHPDFQIGNTRSHFKEMNCITYTLAQN